jgi:hypothetical protein
MEQQTTFRLPRALARRLAERAKQRGVTKSYLVREALEEYLGPPRADAGVMLVREVGPGYLGSLALDVSAAAADPVAAMIRARNWRE